MTITTRDEVRIDTDGPTQPLRAFAHARPRARAKWRRRLSAADNRDELAPAFDAVRVWRTDEVLPLAQDTRPRPRPRIEPPQRPCRVPGGLHANIRLSTPTGAIDDAKARETRCLRAGTRIVAETRGDFRARARARWRLWIGADLPRRAREVRRSH